MLPQKKKAGKSDMTGNYRTEHYTMVFFLGKTTKKCSTSIRLPPSCGFHWPASIQQHN
jgi:hypothetical protein